MNSIHDMGGMHGMGPVVREENEPVFHHEWERRAFAVTIAVLMLDKWNLDMYRHAREQMPPVDYLSRSYYEHWLFAVQTLLARDGVITQAEIEARTAALRSGQTPAQSAKLPVRPAMMTPEEASARVHADIAPRFRVGDRVVTRNSHPTSHTRLPRYARGKQGVIHIDHGVFVFNDTHAMGQGKKPQHVYSVRFTAQELWGPEASPRDVLHLDLWDDHLEPA